MIFEEHAVADHETSGREAQRVAVVRELSIQGRGPRSHHPGEETIRQGLGQNCREEDNFEAAARASGAGGRCGARERDRRRDLRARLQSPRSKYQTQWKFQPLGVNFKTSYLYTIFKNI